MKFENSSDSFQFRYFMEHRPRRSATTMTSTTQQGCPFYRRRSVQRHKSSFVRKVPRHQTLQFCLKVCLQRSFICKTRKMQQTLPIPEVSDASTCGFIRIETKLIFFFPLNRNSSPDVRGLDACTHEQRFRVFVSL